MHVEKSIKLSKKINNKETTLLLRPNFNKTAEIWVNSVQEFKK